MCFYSVTIKASRSKVILKTKVNAVSYQIMGFGEDFTWHQVRETLTTECALHLQQLCKWEFLNEIPNSTFWKHENVFEE